MFFLNSQPAARDPCLIPTQLDLDSEGIGALSG